MDAIGKMQTGHSVEDIDIVIDEVYEARGDYESLEERLDDLPSEEDEAEDRAALVEIIDSGAKNVLSFTEIGRNDSHDSTTVTINGVQFTVNVDRSVTATRVEAYAADAACNFRIDTGTNYVDDYCNGKFILSGCPAGGGDDTYELTALSVATGATYRCIDTGSGVTLSDRDSDTNIFVRILIDSTFTGTATFKPMICSKTAWDISQEYQPFRPSYQELYERVVALEQASGTRSVRTLQADPELPDGEDVEDNREEMR